MPQEPRIESSFLYTREDRSQAFVHDTYRDFFLAKWFSTRINNGRLPMEYAWRNYWSYEEDAELWGLPKDREWRGLLPDLENIAIMLADRITKESLNEFIALLIKPYTDSLGELNEDYYNPFYYDVQFARKLYSVRPQSVSKELKDVLDLYEDEKWAGAKGPLYPIVEICFVEKVEEYKKRYEERMRKRFGGSYKASNEQIEDRTLNELENKKEEFPVVPEPEHVFGVLARVGTRKSLIFLREYTNKVVDLLGHYYWSVGCSEFCASYCALQIIHQRLKPKGYNPPIKKLSS